MMFTGNKEEAKFILKTTTQLVAYLEKEFNTILGQIKEIKKRKADIAVEIEATNHLLSTSVEMIDKSALWPDEMRLYKPIGYIFVLEDLVTIRNGMRSERYDLLTRIHRFQSQIAHLDQKMSVFEDKLRALTGFNLQTREQQRKVNVLLEGM